MIFRRVWKVCGWCTHQGCRLSLWTIWLLLLAALAGQLYLLSARRVPVPTPLRRLIEKQAAAHGVNIEYGRARMNLTGRFLLEDVRLGPTSAPEPLATARSVYLRFNPWELLVGQPQLEEVRIGGLDFHLPADPAANTEAALVANNIDLGLHIAGREVELSYFTGYIGRLPIQASGRLPVSAASSDQKPSVESVINTYATIAAHLRDSASWIDTAEAPRLAARFDHESFTLHVQADSIDLRSLPLPHPPQAKMERVRLNVFLPVPPSSSNDFSVTGVIGAAHLPQEFATRDLRFELRGVYGDASPFDPRQLNVQLASVRWRDIETGPVVATLTEPAYRQFEIDASLVLAGSTWRVKGDAVPQSRSARVLIDGFVGDTTLDFAGRLIKRDLAALLDPAAPAPLHVSATFGPDWKLAGVTGRLHSGPVRVGGAHLDETGTEFTYDGVRAVADNLVLRQGESLAHGSYEMDTRTMDFRFLLTGGLRPEGIESWFHDWWRNFWSDFDFSHALPAAEVDVSGRWGDLTATRVFVQAEGARTGLKGVDFDEVRTRIFLRPHWFDILHFEVVHDEQAARGWLTRSLDLEKNTWSFMEFDVESSLALATISSLFKKESAELLAPYDFTSPPHLAITGRVDSPASPTGKRERIDLTLASAGAMTYHGFPLSNLAFKAEIRDDSIDLPTLAVSFAEGRASGHARLWTADEARRLSFNITLADANLGAVTRAVALLQPPAATPDGKTGDSARERQQRLDQGRLVFNLAAEGLFADFYSFTGSGRAAITGAELAQLNLFGPLSEALSGTHFSFGSFSLDTVDAPFVLDGDRLRFEELRVTGPSALLQAKGNYHLRDGRLDFATKIHPFDESRSMVGSAFGFMLSPLSKMFEVKLQGTFSKPTWIFAYGPSRLFNTLTGSGSHPAITPLTPLVPVPTEPNTPVQSEP